MITADQIREFIRANPGMTAMRVARGMAPDSPVAEQRKLRNRVQRQRSELTKLGQAEPVDPKGKRNQARREGRASPLPASAEELASMTPEQLQVWALRHAGEAVTAGERSSAAYIQALREVRATHAELTTIRAASDARRREEATDEEEVALALEMLITLPDTLFEAVMAQVYERRRSTPSIRLVVSDG